MQPTKYFDRYKFLKEPMIRTPAQHQTDPAKLPGTVKEPLENFMQPQAPTPLADYIERVLEAEKALPERVEVDLGVLLKCISALSRSNPYISEVLQKELDKVR